MLLRWLRLYYICASLPDLKCLQTAVSSEDGEVHSSILETIQCHEWDAPLLHLPSLPHLSWMLLWSLHPRWPQSQREHLEKSQKTPRMWLVKFVLLVSVHTTSVNGAQFSEASKFHILLCLNVLQVAVLMESRHTNVWSRHSDSQIIPHMFSRSCFKAVWRHHGLPHLLCSLRQRQPQCFFLIHDQIPVSQQQRGSWWTAKTGEGGHGGQLQSWHSCVEMAVGCVTSGVHILLKKTHSYSNTIYWLSPSLCIMCQVFKCSFR